ncbi:MAG: SIMPL domain-containing protein [Syntrophaceae bacterium]|nr:SIMPL domain-containing protein [Syntrophaceae bacterium]
MRKTFALFAVALTALACSTAAAQFPEDPGCRPAAVTVTGSGETHAKPDFARVHVGVVTEGATAAEALRKNNEAMSQLIVLIRKRGIEDRDVQTSQFNVAPRYRYDKDQRESPKIAGYQVTNELSVKVRDMTRLGGFLDETVALGANQVRGVSFGVAEPAPLMDEARRKAMADALRRARVYAEAAGVRIGKPVKISEQEGARPGPYPVARMEAAAASGVPVAPGEQTFTVSVTVSYPIVDAK